MVKYSETETATQVEYLTVHGIADLNIGRKVFLTTPAVDLTYSRGTENGYVNCETE